MIASIGVRRTQARTDGSSDWLFVMCSVPRRRRLCLSPVPALVFAAHPSISGLRVDRTVPGELILDAVGYYDRRRLCFSCQTHAGEVVLGKESAAISARLDALRSELYQVMVLRLVSGSSGIVWAECTCTDVGLLLVHASNGPWSSGLQSNISITRR
ncbi:hypothetical protein EXIGLDRAFT_383371 [Exidia glandulosa HHB12029]|uniref:Uncharacterized protein n=1 Tax=Exidia glandulosa HHB12029 TaxID=1314781 RepID=A0A165L2V9_EXIGL|nr:hypothetical protein EXIGLDRAFT_383371 [Exidia glandulosa HHB12029]